MCSLFGSCIGKEGISRTILPETVSSFHGAEEQALILFPTPSGPGAVSAGAADWWESE